MSVVSVPSPRLRMFLPKEFKVTVWSRLKPYYGELLKRTIASCEELEEWLFDRSELSAVVDEDLKWRFIHLSSNNVDEKREDAYLYAIQEIQPKVIAFENQLDQKLVDSPFCLELKGKAKQYEIYLRNLKGKLAIYQADNIALSVEAKIKEKEYVSLLSKITIVHQSKELTLTEVKGQLKNTDRSIREELSLKKNERLFENRGEFESIFDTLVGLRHQMALNAGMENYQDFRFIELNRFDYTAAECVNYHEAIKQEVLPIIEKNHQQRKRKLGIDQLRPWDLFVDMEDVGAENLYESLDEFVDKTIDCLSAVHPSFGKSLSIIKEMDCMDLASRKGKRLGGFSINLPISKMSYIFMSSNNSSQDIRTMVHESGHAIHNYMMRGFDLESASNPPFEAAELVGLTMELLTMEHWGIYFENPDQLRAAKIQQLTKALNTLCWVATIDKFQHWLYLHPNHTRDERINAWMQIFEEFDSKVVDRTGLEKYTNYMWHRQTHVFNLPFYYIEYGFAQLGALAIWKSYRLKPEKTIKNFRKAMALGNTRTLKEIYETAGVDFDFSFAYVRDLMVFLHKELDQLQNNKN